MQVSHLKLELNTANNRNKTYNVLENINTEQRERKIYSRLIYIHELSSITKEIIKQDESVFYSFAEHFQGCNLFIFAWILEDEGHGCQSYP